jgi:serine/threonine-protein kinase
VKYLLLHLDREHGRLDGDNFLQLARLERDYLEDETRPLAIERWRSALEVFSSRWGREELLRTTRSVVEAGMLGVWTRVLRGASLPATAYEQLDQYGGDQVLTEVWQTLEATRTRWRGRITLQEHERDDLCTLARTVELSAVPLLFGLAPATVTAKDPEPDGSGGLMQEFTAEWAEVGQGLIIAGGALGATVGGLFAALSGSEAMLATTIAAVTGGAGAALGAAWALTRKRALEARAHVVRLQALERAAALRETREHSAQGFREGTLIAGQYRLVQHLGSGASGAIWEAVRLSDAAIVAVKVLRTAMAHDTVAADRLRREAAALGLAWHPNVVEVYDEGNLPDGTIYLVLERLRGESLATRLRRERKLSPQDLLEIALQVCDALGAVHAAGVVHRDLKPSNVYLHQADAQSAPRVKLLDFGIARVEWAETRITNMGAPLGTPGYMSPEQLQGMEVDSRSDLFALGSVLYECLSGEPPPTRLEELWRERAEEAPSGVQRALSDVPPAWRAVIEKATAPAPRDRYQDARAFRDALASLSEGDAPGPKETATSFA